MSNESKKLLEQMQDDEACKNCKMRKAINYIATEAASDICNNLSAKRSWEFVEEYVDNVEVLLSKGMFNIAFRDVFVNIYVYGAESTVDLFDAFIVGEKERIPCFLNMFCTQCRIIFDIVKNV